MVDTPTAPIVNRATIAGRAILEIAADLACPSCGTTVRGIDAELLDPGFRLNCFRCYQTILNFDPVR
jgi:hypothetical protein